MILGNACQVMVHSVGSSPLFWICILISCSGRFGLGSPYLKWFFLCSSCIVNSFCHQTVTASRILKSPICRAGGGGSGKHPAFHEKWYWKMLFRWWWTLLGTQPFSEHIFWSGTLMRMRVMGLRALSWLFFFCYLCKSFSPLAFVLQFVSWRF